MGSMSLQKLRKRPLGSRVLPCASFLGCFKCNHFVELGELPLYRGPPLH
jgi:hypothetical protein